MKKILVTGANSYIGASFERWVSKKSEEYSVDKISVRDDRWKEYSFKEYDAVYHTAAIVHVKENDEDKYYKVNRDLTIDIAKKAKEEGVKQFIFLSTMGVYGTETGYITHETLPAPKAPYAKSKYEAEQLLLEIKSDDFKVAILRPPLVYGEGCPGNYTRLSTLALRLPFFPDINNKRSMIFIDNLSEFVRLIMDQSKSGIFFPQNKEYVSTTELMKNIAKVHEKNLKATKLFNFGFFLVFNLSATFRKVFGSFVYDKQLLGGPESEVYGENFDYTTCSFYESIKMTESKKYGDGFYE
jgi:UDP-glucose 4-epimerase